MIESLLYKNVDSSSAPTLAAGSLATTASGWYFFSAHVLDAFVSTDTSETSSRISDHLELQVGLAGVSATPQAAIGVMVSDGVRALAVSLGPTLRVVSIEDCEQDTVGVIASDVPWQAFNTLRVWKVGSERWDVFLNGRHCASIPYLLAEETADPVASYRIGQLAGTVSATECVLAWYEASVNLALAPEETVRQAAKSLPPEIRPQPNAPIKDTLLRAILRTQVGIQERSKRNFDALLTAPGCGRIALDTYTLNSSSLVDWTEVDTPDASVTRGRVRIAGAGLLQHAIDTSRPEETETWIQTDVTFRGTPDADSFAIIFDDATRHIRATLVSLGAAGLGFQLNVASALIRQIATPSASQPRTYRLALHATSEFVLLLVDGCIVDRIPYASFPASDGDYTSTVSIGWLDTPACAVDVETLTVVRSLSDLQLRPFQLQTAVDRVLFPSGCERNDELRVWMDSHFRVQSLRGTEAGLLTELKRIGCTEDVFLSRVATPSHWVLSQSYPSVTPIWLSLNSDILNLAIEVGYTSHTNFTLARLVEVVALYLLPVSLVERIYNLYVTTASTETVASGTDIDVEVVSSLGFSVDDRVEVVSYDRSVVNPCHITAITGNVLTLSRVTTEFTYDSDTPPYVRRWLTDTRQAR